MVDDPTRFDIPHAEIRASQVAAAQERFAGLRDRIKLLHHRAGEAGLETIGGLAKLVPLLFAHTSYKSYPDNWLLQATGSGWGVGWAPCRQGISSQPISRAP